VRYDPNGAIVVLVKVNGIPAHMIFDTGATRTVLSKQFAANAGIEATESQIVSTANGDALVFGGRADSISLGDARLGSVPIFIQTSTNSSFGKGIDGLLGLSFLGNFQVRINAGLLELRPRE
jgi:clan AA aspartic protease (TIGR02281 family)